MPNSKKKNMQNQPVTKKDFARLEGKLILWKNDLLEEVDARIGGYFEKVQDKIKIISEQVISLDQKFETRFDGVDQRLDRVESRLTNVEVRLDDVENRLSNVDSTMEYVVVAVNDVDDRLEVIESLTVLQG